MEMLLLRFTKAEIGGTERHVGVINWLEFILLTAAKKNNLVCGDNKGYASRLLRPA